ncbi:MAG TPA: ATPase domain-containing protein, partial [bacterium]|nr:ATPase domain-containing protein [bacterium]
MARLRFAYACQGCGARFPKWLGRCPDCGAWNSILQEAPPEPGSILAFTPRATTAPAGPQTQSLLPREAEATHPRLATGLGEVDRVLGGGLLEGTVALLGGDPGIGKSTLVLQLLDRAAARGLPALYISGEESPAQIRSR